jgi:hypothetical protein
MKMKSQDDLLSNTEMLIGSVEQRLHDEAAKNREEIDRERRQELIDSGLPAAAAEAREALPKIEKLIADARPFFARAQALDLHAVPAAFGHITPIADACRQFRLIASTPRALSEGLSKFKELEEVYCAMDADLTDRKRKIAAVREFFANRHVENIKSAIQRNKDTIESALKEIDRQLQYERARHPDMKVKTAAAPAPAAKPSEKGLVETEFTPSYPTTIS